MFRRTALVAALMTVAPFLVATPAAQAAGLPGCISGGFTEFGWVDGVVRAAGSALPCPSTPLPETFAVIGYSATQGYVRPSGTYLLPSRTVPTPFTVIVTTPGIVAVCVGNPKTLPVDCLRVDARENQLPLVYRIPPDDPAVRKPIVFLDSADPQPGCGNCV